MDPQFSSKHSNYTDDDPRPRVEESAAESRVLAPTSIPLSLFHPQSGAAGPPTGLWCECGDNWPSIHFII